MDNFEALKNLDREQMAVFLAMNEDENEYYHITDEFYNWLNKDSTFLMDQLIKDKEFVELVNKLKEKNNE